MGTARRATVYLDSELHRALRVKAAETDKSISDLVNDAVRHDLAEDAEDLDAYRARAKEPPVDLEKVLKDLKRRGKL
jgi:plasmid stability protein